MIKHWGCVALLLVSGCQKHEEGAPAPSAAPPAAVSVAPVPEPPAPPAAAPQAEAPVAASAAPAASAVAAASATPDPAGAASAAEVKKFVPGGDLTACCTAIAAAAKKPGPTQNHYTAASAVCGGLAKAVKTGKANFASAKVTLHAQLAGVPVPPGC